MDKAERMVKIHLEDTTLYLIQAVTERVREMEQDPAYDSEDIAVYLNQVGNDVEKIIKGL